MENFDGLIVFVRTKNATEELAERLRARGFEAAAINGDVVQAQRERTIEQLRKGKLDILVATDVAARGLDVQRISHVVNHDIPTDTESYVHRIGRTGRAGRSGVAISFVTPREAHLLRAIEKTNRTTLQEMRLPTVADVNASRVSRFTEAIGQALGDPQVAVFRELVAAYEQEHDVPAQDIAAAIAVLAQDGEPLLLEEGAETPSPARDRRSGARRELAAYRIEVGRKQRVEPRQIVGALANEGGLSREDFGRDRHQAGVLDRRAAGRAPRRHVARAGEDPDRGRPDRPQAGSLRRPSSSRASPAERGLVGVAGRRQEAAAQEAHSETGVIFPGLRR